jgi:hypothetical protein
MSVISLAIAFTALAAMPASAGTSRLFTCTGEGDTHFQFELFADGGGYDDASTPLIWLEQNGVTIVVEEINPSMLVVSFVPETGDGLAPYEPGALLPVTCTVGAE